jgi:manganese efflux pump family protein
VFSLILAAAALGLSNFAASIAIGLSGVDGAVRLRVALVFGAFEAAMPALGLIVGRHIARSVGSASSYLGGGLLIATGCYTFWQARRAGSDQPPGGLRLGRLVASGAALSVDNLVVGFALGTHKVSVPVGATVIAAVSVAMSLLGLELGQRLGKVAERWSEEIGGAVLMLVGVAIAVRLL